MNTLNFLSNSTENNYQKILENINAMIKSFDDSNTRDALEGILKYNKAGRCITFFGDQKTKVNYLAPTGNNPLLQQKNLTKREIHQKKEEFQHQFQRVAKIKSTIEQDTTIPQVIKDIYIHKITSLEKSFKMFQSALWLEAEKSGYPLSDEQRNHYQQAVVQQQKWIYGKRVSDTPEEVKAVLTNLHSFSPAEKANLNEEEQQIFSTFLQAMDKKFQFDNTKCQPKAPETSNIALPKEKNISPKELYDLAIEILNFYKYLYPHNQELQQWEIVQEPNSNFINVSGKEKVVSIPTTYDNVDSEKVTRTIAAHEIEQHVIQRVNNHTLFWKTFIGGERYDFISEGVAVFNEDIAIGKINNFSDIQNAKDYFNGSILRIFIWENCTYEESIQLVKIYRKLTTPNESDAERSKFAENRVRRIKRFISHELPGASLKDTSYSRGKNRVIDYLTDYGKDTTPETIMQRYRNLYIGKLWPNDIPHLPEIKQALWITDDQIVVPYFIGRILADKYNQDWKKASIQKYPSEIKRSLENYFKNNLSKEILERIPLNDFEKRWKVLSSMKRRLITILQQIRKAEVSPND